MRNGVWRKCRKMLCRDRKPGQAFAVLLIEHVNIIRLFQLGDALVIRSVGPQQFILATTPNPAIGFVGLIAGCEKR